MSQSADTIRSLVSEGAKLKSEIELKTKRLKEITAQLVELGAGDYEGDGGEKCKVIQPSASIKPTAEDIEAARELVSEDHFKMLFDREVKFSATKAFRELAEKLLTPAKAKKLIGLVEKASAAFVKWS